jgi:endoglucanase
MSAVVNARGAPVSLEKAAIQRWPTAESGALELRRGINILGADPYFTGAPGHSFSYGNLRSIKRAGFSTVRIDQAFSPEISLDGTPNAIWLQKMDNIINEALRIGLNVIINNNNTNMCNDQPDECSALLILDWGILASHWQNLPSNVSFEILNEPAGKFNSALWNKSAIAALSQIRKTNPNRNVVIGTCDANGFRCLDELRLPKSDPHIIVTVHYYDPLAFTHQGANWIPFWHRPPLGRHFGSPTEIAQVREDFNHIHEWSIREHRPVYLGEFGVLETAPLTERLVWMNAVIEAAEANNISWAYWQFETDFYAFDRDKQTWVKPILETLTQSHH